MGGDNRGILQDRLRPPSALADHIPTRTEPCSLFRPTIGSDEAQDPGTRKRYSHSGSHNGPIAISVPGSKLEGCQQRLRREIWEIARRALDHAGARYTHLSPRPPGCTSPPSGTPPEVFRSPSLLLHASITTIMGAQNSTMLWDGLQNSALGSGLSSACDGALNTTLNCPANELQYLSWSMQSVQWSTAQLNSLCTPACSSSLSTLLSNVQSGCGSAAFNFNGGQMTWVQQIQYLQYKYGLVCLKDAATSNFCTDVENSWNINSMVAAGSATWPSNTAKCYPNLASDSIDATLDTNGSCINTFDVSVFQDNTLGWTASGQVQAADFYSSRGAPNPNDNYGWPQPLEADEYPLQIQCSSCFVQKYIYGYSSTWGDLWDTISQQVWSNMKANCNLNQNISPANDFSNVQIGNIDTPYWQTDYTQCAQTFQTTPRSTCNQMALQHSVPSAALASLNPDAVCAQLMSQTLCAPASCPLGVNNGPSASIDTFLSQYTNFTKTQFLTWNAHVNTKLINNGEAVCVGPPGGMYQPALVASTSTSTSVPTSPSTSLTTSVRPMTTTTTTTTQNPNFPSPPGPTVTGTTNQCRKWYTVVSGDNCYNIAQANGITLAQFYKWNTFIDSNCDNIWPGYSYCVSGP
ncbi:hypothetical protein ANO11243_017810 [Dothideomycetidae sp. 11243]|nr:hypothetical protein ANO11243_017810 [fungal sp. No.11243]